MLLACAACFARRGSGSVARSLSSASAAASSSSRDAGKARRGRRRKGPPAPAPFDPSPLPVVVLLGRPNVGKSALFNRLTGSRKALVRDTPGSHVTRDWRSSREGRLADLRFEVVDTSGLEEQQQQQQGRPRSVSDLGSRAASLTASLLRDRADVALLLLDAKEGGVTPADDAIARWLRRSGVLPPSVVPSSSPPPQKRLSVVVAVNKAESARSDPAVAAAVASAGSLGFGDGVGVSAETGEGMTDLYEALAPPLDAAAERLRSTGEREGGVSAESEDEGEDDGASSLSSSSSSSSSPSSSPKKMRLVLVGAPNAGKSTLSNALLGSERSLTGPEPGLTRDAVWASLEWEEEGEGEEEETKGRREAAEAESAPSPPPLPLRRRRVVELIDTAGWDRRTARAAALKGASDGEQSSGGNADAADAPSSSSSCSPASALAAPADVIAEAMRQTERGINLAHVVVVVVDLAASASAGAAAGEGSSVSLSRHHLHRQVLTKTELALAARAAEAGRAVVFVGAKADLLSPSSSSPQSDDESTTTRRGKKKDFDAAAAAARALSLDVSRRLPQLEGAPVLALSATTGLGLSDLLPAVARAHEAWSRRVPTSRLNRWLRDAKDDALAKSGGGRGRKGGGDAAARSLSSVRYLTQASSRPPSFVAFVRGGSNENNKGSSAAAAAAAARKRKKAEAEADERLERMLTNRIRDAFGMRGVPIRVAVRRGG